MNAFDRNAWVRFALAYAVILVFVALVTCTRWTYWPDRREDQVMITASQYALVVSEHGGWAVMQEDRPLVSVGQVLLP